MSKDTRPLQEGCDCSTCTCSNYSRAYLHLLSAKDGSVGAQFLTLHNIAYLAKLMLKTRQAITDGTDFTAPISAP